MTAMRRARKQCESDFPSWFSTPGAHRSADDGVHGTELWRSDGTAAGTVTGFAGGVTCELDSMVSMNGSLYLEANDGVSGRELWTLAPNVKVGEQVVITGADQPEYNGVFTVTGVTADAFTYTITGSPASAASGRIVVQSSIEQREYDADGNVRFVTDSLGYGLSSSQRHNDHLHTTETVYDNIGRVKQIDADADGDPNTTGDSPVTQWVYNAFGELLSITDPDNNTTSYTYDSIGRQLTATNALGKVETTVYDAFGNVQKVTDRNGRTIEYTYDRLDRKTTEVWKNSTGAVLNTITNGYDVEGRLLTVSDSNASYVYTYDADGRLLTSDNNGTANMPRTIITNVYDIQGRRTSQTTSVNGAVQCTDTYTYDALNRLYTEVQTGPAGSLAKAVKFTYRADDSYDTIYRHRFRSLRRVVWQVKENPLVSFLSIEQVPDDSDRRLALRFSLKASEQNPRTDAVVLLSLSLDGEKRIVEVPVVIRSITR